MTTGNICIFSMGLKQMEAEYEVNLFTVLFLF